MDAAVIVTKLRSAGYLPALLEGKIRVYGDTSNMPATLREALVTNRDVVAVYLRQPEQSIALDLIANATEAGWLPHISDSSLEWLKGEARSINPMRSEALQDALEHHRDAVVAVLQQMPAGCHDRQCCARVGICPEATDERECIAAPVSLPVVPPDVSQRPVADPPVEGAYHRIWTCASCNLPRSDDDRPCPACGTVDGYMALRPANRFTGLL